MGSNLHCCFCFCFYHPFYYITIFALLFSLPPSRISYPGSHRPMLMETRCCKGFFPNYSKMKLAEDALVPPRWGKRKINVCFKYYLFTRLHAADLVLSRWKWSTHWSKTAHATIDLRSRHRMNPRPTRFSAHYRPNVFVPDTWPAPATYNRPCCEHGDQSGSEPLTGAPRSDFMTKPLVLLIDVCRGLGISPLRIKLLAEFSQTDVGPTFAQELFFRFFFSTLGTFLWRFVLIASGTKILPGMAGIFEIRFFFLATWRFHRIGLKALLSPPH